MKSDEIHTPRAPIHLVAYIGMEFKYIYIILKSILVDCSLSEITRGQSLYSILILSLMNLPDDLFWQTKSTYMRQRCGNRNVFQCNGETRSIYMYKSRQRRKGVLFKFEQFPA